MQRRNPPAKWILPTVLHPPTTRCFTIEVPNERFYIAAFRGALLNLAAGYNWQDDAAHTAREVALVWRSIVNAVTYCEPPPDNDTGIAIEDSMSTQIRISPTDGCIIQMWCIDHWEDWYDPRACLPGGTGQQQSDGGQPQAGEEQEYCIQINASQPYLYPVAVNSGDVISITELRGAWSDQTGGLASLWYCGDGGQYILGACTGSSTTDAGDPLPLIKHMSVIAAINGSYYPLGQNGIFTVPAGVSNEQMLLIPNVAVYATSTGSIGCCVKIVTPPVFIALSYANGASGPSTVTPGSTIEINSGLNGIQENVFFQTSQQVRITVLAYAGWVIHTPDVLVNTAVVYTSAAYGSTGQIIPSTDTSGVPTDVTALSLAWGLAVGGDNANPFTITVKVDSV